MGAKKKGISLIGDGGACFKSRQVNHVKLLESNGNRRWSSYVFMSSQVTGFNYWSTWFRRPHNDTCLAFNEDFRWFSICFSGFLAFIAVIGDFQSKSSVWKHPDPLL